MSNIKKKVPRVVWDALVERRHEAIEAEVKIKYDALEEIGSSLSKDDKSTLIEVYTK